MLGEGLIGSIRRPVRPLQFLEMINFVLEPLDRLLLCLDNTITLVQLILRGEIFVQFRLFGQVRVRALELALQLRRVLRFGNVVELTRPGQVCHRADRGHSPKVRRGSNRLGKILFG